MTIVRDCDPPVEIAAGHRMHDALIDRTSRLHCFDIVGARGPMNETRSFGERCPHPRLVQIEPTRARRSFAFGVDRDDFEVLPWAEADERVVRTHHDVLAARLRADAESRFDEIATVGERLRCDDEVIERDAAQCGGASSGAKSSSTRAPLGSKKNTCHGPSPTWRRNVCSTPCAVRLASVSASPTAENAMWSITPDLRSARERPPTMCRIADGPEYNQAPGK